MLWARKYSESTLSHSPVISHYPDFLGNSPRCPGNKEMCNSDSSAWRLIPCLIPCHVSVVKISVIWSLLARVPALSQGLRLITRRWLPRPGWHAMPMSDPSRIFSNEKKLFTFSLDQSRPVLYLLFIVHLGALSNLTISVRKSISYIDQNLILGTRHLPADIDDINIDEDGEFRKQSFSFYAESCGPFWFVLFLRVSLFLFFHCSFIVLLCGNKNMDIFSHLLHTVSEAIYLCSSIE